jgi:pectate lyase
VSDYTSLVNAISDDTPRVVQISGTITPASGVKMVHVGSNKTIIGLGSTAVLQGMGLDVSGWTAAVRAAHGGAECLPAYAADFNHVSNVIIRNITFAAPTDDGIQVSCYSHHVWIDHNTFTKGYDGSIDIKRGSDWVTVSWNHLNHTDKTMLLGHDDSNGPQDIGHLHVTYHHNFMDNTTQRNPRVRFGQAHVYNNYANHISSYFIGLGVGCDVYADGNYLQFADAVTDDFGGDNLTWHSSNIVIDTDHAAVANGQAFNPASYYSYPLDSAANLPSIVPAGAGVGKI